jgi:DNA-directed RNA polymerase specialized sigma24 family protein
MINRADYGSAYQCGFERTVRFLSSRGVCRDIAEEIAQEAWVVGWERIGQLRNEDLLRTWVNTIALNLYRRSTWAEKRKRPLRENAGRTSLNTAAMDVAHLLRSCCPADRLLLVQQLSGFTTSEMAQETHSSETAVRLRLMRARRSARSIIEASPPICRSETGHRETCGGARGLV